MYRLLPGCNKDGRSTRYRRPPPHAVSYPRALLNVFDELNTLIPSNTRAVGRMFHLTHRDDSPSKTSVYSRYTKDEGSDKIRQRVEKVMDTPSWAFIRDAHWRISSNGIGRGKSRHSSRIRCKTKSRVRGRTVLGKLNQVRNRQAGTPVPR
jgi:hypothetical protein